VVAVATAFLCVSSAATAQEPPAALDGVALSRFEPSERGSRFFIADSLELHHGTAGLSHPGIAAGIASTWAWRSRTFGTLKEGERSHFVENALYLHPGASLVLAPGARFALDVPIVAAQSGESTNLAGRYYRAPGSPRLGDIRASFDLLFSGPPARDTEGLAIAGGVNAWLPTGATSDFVGDTGARFGVHVTSAARFGSFLGSLRAGYMYRREGFIGGSLVGSEVNAAIGIAYADDVWTVGPELWGSTVIDAAFAERTSPLEILTSIRRAFGPFRLAFGVGRSLGPGMGAARVRGVLSLEWAPSLPASDRDRDGVPDRDDACPDVAGRAGDGGPATIRGCPPPPDTAADGIPGHQDACPAAARSGVPAGAPRSHGCPPSPTTPTPSISPPSSGPPPMPPRE
jgi:OmpA-OmpF porin, OOP family